MKKESDLDGVKAIAKALLIIDICTTQYFDDDDNIKDKLVTVI